MKRISTHSDYHLLSLRAGLAIVGGTAISADKYTVQVPGGLAFSEFRGYEDWPVISLSDNNGKFAAILGNPVMMDALRAGVPGNGKPFPDGSKMAKIHWTPKTQATYPGPPKVPATQANADFMVKDGTRFADSGGWDGASSPTTTQRPIRLARLPRRQRRRKATTRSAGLRVTHWRKATITFSPSSRTGETASGPSSSTAAVELAIPMTPD